MIPYKFLPETYKNFVGLYDEMVDFYVQLENHQAKQDRTSRLLLETQLNNLLFSIKHREVEGRLPKDVISDMRVYFRGLVYD